MTTIDEKTALTELGKYLSLIRHGGQLPMFSRYIDEKWHRLIDNPDHYGTFCTQHAGAPVRHLRVVGEGPVGWVPLYERAYGQLPEVWFADADGVVDEGLLAAYRRTGTVVTGWDCCPARPDHEDADDGGTADPQPIHTAPHPQEQPLPGWGALTSGHVA